MYGDRMGGPDAPSIALLEAIWTIDLSGATEATLQFEEWGYEVNIEQSAPNLSPAPRARTEWRSVQTGSTGTPIFTPYTAETTTTGHTIDLTSSPAGASASGPDFRHQVPALRRQRVTSTLLGPDIRYRVGSLSPADPFG